MKNVAYIDRTNLQQGTVKGNADAEMVLKSVRDVFEQDIENIVLIYFEKRIFHLHGCKIHQLLKK